jgi:hypothetical protein
MNFNCIPGGIQAVCCDFAALESSQFHPFSSLIYTFYTFSSTFRTNLPIWMGRSRGDTHHLGSWESLVKRKRLRDRCCKLPTTQPLQTTHGAPLTVEHRCPQVQSWRGGCCDGKTLEVSVDVSYILSPRSPMYMVEVSIILVCQRLIAKTMCDSSSHVLEPTLARKLFSTPYDPGHSHWLPIKLWHR